MKLASLSRRDIERNLPEQFITRGEDYVRERRVLKLQAGSGPGRYDALVDGNEAAPYKVEVQVFPGNGGARIYGKCSCPVGVNCKHVAAVLLSVVDRPPPRLASGAVRAPSVAGVPAAAPAAADAVPPQPVERPLPAEWRVWLAAARAALDRQQATTAAGTRTRLYYLLEPSAVPGLAGVGLTFHSARPRADGGPGAGIKPWRNFRSVLGEPPAFVTPEDRRLVRRLLLDGQPASLWNLLLTDHADEIMPALLASGRCHLWELSTPALRAGAPRRGEARWELDPDGQQQLRWLVEPPADLVLSVSPPWYIDLQAGECGPVESSWAPEIAGLLTRIPPVPEELADGVHKALESGLAGLAVPGPVTGDAQDVAGIVPVPCLRLATLQVMEHGHRPVNRYLRVAGLRFDYEGVRAGPGDPGILRQSRGQRLRRIRRDPESERRAHARLGSLGFTAASELGIGLPPAFADDCILPRADDWVSFMVETLPMLEAEGWAVEYDDSFDCHVVRSGEWHADVSDAGRDWFDLSLGVDVDGQRMDLLPVVLALLRSRRDELFGDPNASGKPRHLGVVLEDGRVLPVPLERVRPIVAVLDELLDAAPAGPLRMRRLDASRLRALEDGARLSWHGGEELRAFGDRLLHFDGVRPVPPPPGLDATLRPYQAEGLAWLQFLREYGLGGVLADDMGLGKTLQALAHVQCEKVAGRLDCPALIVAPTSVVPNWRTEAARFTPGLRVHVSHGLKRKEALDRLGQYDVVLTTYPLLPRDREVLESQEFHLVILDEAQQVKNAQTQAAAVVRNLRARHRLCLTGTPLENHLGELWSLFNFLMPGFLGDATSFRRHYRTPIEKHGDEGRRAGLERRLRPFLLRRTKEAVAADLPPKTEIVRRVELAGAQRQLYETVRAAMDERVRREIAERGLAQSQIVVLDALLKLRQVCCDPRLVKLDAARRVAESAKLELLMEMLDELLAEGRRVLLFSQFTEMLALVEAELGRRGVRYVLLTGETRDRARPVKAFQAGEVPLFLISLKAGGTGLNLTAADTVIHYDPWWNPAVERQATDRAHRIGQTRPVFVYKLIVAGSVEEKISVMQARKAALAEAVLGEPGRAAAPLSPDDIAALFEPMEAQ